MRRDSIHTRTHICAYHHVHISTHKNDAIKAWIKEAGRMNHLKHVRALEVIPPSHHAHTIHIYDT